jgi:hypothetical protein
MTGAGSHGTGFVPWAFLRRVMRVCARGQRIDQREEFPARGKEGRGEDVTVTKKIRPVVSSLRTLDTPPE